MLDKKQDIASYQNVTSFGYIEDLFHTVESTN